MIYVYIFTTMDITRVIKVIELLCHLLFLFSTIFLVSKRGYRRYDTTLTSSPSSLKKEKIKASSLYNVSKRSIENWKGESEIEDGKGLWCWCIHSWFVALAQMMLIMKAFTLHFLFYALCAWYFENFCLIFGRRDLTFLRKSLKSRKSWEEFEKLLFFLYLKKNFNLKSHFWVVIFGNFWEKLIFSLLKKYFFFCFGKNFNLKTSIFFPINNIPFFFVCVSIKHIYFS